MHVMLNSPSSIINDLECLIYTTWGGWGVIRDLISGIKTTIKF